MPILNGHFDNEKVINIVIVGSTMIDMVTYSKKIPAAGETVFGDTFSLGFGGKGGNQAIMASRLGANVSMVNTLGDDVFGDSYLKNFQEQGVDTAQINRTHGASGVASILVEPDGTNRIICVPGANNAMTTGQAESAIRTIPNISVVVGQLEIPQAVTTSAFRVAKELGAITILNPAPQVRIDAQLLAVSDWIIPNETEFLGMHPKRQAPESDEIIKELAKTFSCRLAVTLGPIGVAFTDSKGEIIRISAPQVTAIDSTGAGDAFVGAFAFGLAGGLTEAQAIRLGCLCASDSVTRLGTQSSYPTPVQAQGFLNLVRGSAQALNTR